jgi:hypothetical protein
MAFPDERACGRDVIDLGPDLTANLRKGLLRVSA